MSGKWVLVVLCSAAVGVLSVAASAVEFVDSGQRLGTFPSMDVGLADLDGDGDLDAFVATYHANPDLVWINDGTGYFADSGQRLGNSYSYAVALGDIDGDNDVDAFVAALGYSSAGAPNFVWLNDGVGNFTDSGQRLGNRDSNDVALGDLDGDGDLDAFVANHEGQPDEIWLNDGAGHFTDSGQRLGASYSKEVVLRDLDLDGDLDAVVASSSPQSATVWLNDGQGAFALLQSFGSSSALGLSVDDFNGDGFPDVFLAIGTGPGGSPTGAPNEVWINNGFAIFSDSSQRLNDNYSSGCASGDLDLDGDCDVFVVNRYSQGSAVFLNDGTGLLSHAELDLPDSDSESVALGDVDGDGDLDAFVANYASSSADKVWFNVTNRRPIADAGPDQTVPWVDDMEGLTEVHLDGTGSYDPDGDELFYEWSAPDGVILNDPESPTPIGWFPCGEHLLTLTVTDGINDPVLDDVLVTVVDEMPPVLVCTTDKIALWPPDHRMVDVTVCVVASDNCTDPSELILLCNVTSSEPDDALGDGAFTGDVNGFDGYTPPGVPVELQYDPIEACFYGMVSLRAERDGTASGRTYSINCEVLDEQGNLSTASCVVVVPHDRRKK